MATLTYSPSAEAPFSYIEALPFDYIQDVGIFKKMVYEFYDFISKCKDFQMKWEIFFTDPFGAICKTVIRTAKELTLFLLENHEVFVIVGMVGMDLIMTGYVERGMKCVGIVLWGHLVLMVVAVCL